MGLGTLQQDLSVFDSALTPLREVLGCQALEIDIRTDWASRPENLHRIEIRKALSHRTGRDQSDLSQLPAARGHSVSVSHCPLAGGYAVAPSPFEIGLDLESARRVRSEAMMRVSCLDEVQRAPSPARLWASKEAVFKSLKNHPSCPPTLAGVRISNWVRITDRKLEPLGEVFSFNSQFVNSQRHLSGKGLVLELSGLVVAFFVLNAST